MNPWDIYGMVLVCLSVVYLVPQIIKMYWTKSVNDISEVFLWYITIVHLLWTIFNVHLIQIEGWSTLPYFLNNIDRVGFSIFSLFLYYRYKNKKNYDYPITRYYYEGNSSKAIIKYKRKLKNYLDFKNKKKNG